MTNKQPERSVEEIMEEYNERHCAILGLSSGMLIGTNSEEDFVKACENTEKWLTQTLQAERQKREEMVEAERNRIAKRVWEVADKNSWVYDDDHEDMVLYLNDIPAIIELALTQPTPLTNDKD